jgi:pristinamycin I synthase 3 and 4
MDQLGLAARNRPIWRQIEDVARANPDRVALRMGELSRTYGWLLGEVDRWSSLLASRDVGPGDVVALHLPRGPLAAIALLATLRVGAAFLPLAQNLPALRQRVVLEMVRPRVAISDIPDELQSDCEILNAWDLNAPVGMETKTASCSDAAALAYIMFTSGSTGNPRGVCISMANLTAAITTFVEKLEIGPDHTMVWSTTLSFDISLLELLTPMMVGATIDICPEETVYDTQALSSFMHKRRPDFMQATPTQWQLLVAARWQGADSLTVLCGGEPMDRTLAHQLRQRSSRVLNLYGPTETTIWVTCWEVPLNAEKVRIGSALPHVRLIVADADGKPVAVGEEGELWIAGEAVGIGYWQDESTTVRNFPAVGPFGAERAFRTGDRARQIGNEFVVRGRLDDQVKIRGHRIEPGEIQGRIIALAAVEDCAVVPRIQGNFVESLAAFYVANAPTVSSDHHWRDFWSGETSPYEMERPAKKAELDLAGWRFGRQAIPEKVMLDLVEDLAAKIASLAPDRVLEIGYGTGMLLSRVAATTSQYVATELSEAARSRVRSGLLSKRPDLQHVELVTPDDLQNYPAGSFDLAVANSVLQYFDSFADVEAQVASLARLVRPGGHIILGDLRLLDFAGHEMRARTNPALFPPPVDDLQIVIADAAAVLDDELMFGLAGLDQLSHVSGVASALVVKRPLHRQHPLSRFRVDMLLRIGTVAEPSAIDIYDWAQMEQLPNPRELARPCLVLNYPEPSRHNAPDRVGSESGIVALILSSTPTGTLPLLICPPGINPLADVHLPRDRRRAIGPFANRPADAAETRRFSAVIAADVQSFTPQWLVPVEFHRLTSMPMTANGKVDRVLLSRVASKLAGKASGRPGRDPASIAEKLVLDAAIAALGHSFVDLEQGLFEQGATSLMALELRRRLQRAGWKVDLREVFRAKRLTDLAAVVVSIQPAEAVTRNPDLRFGDSHALTPNQSRIWFEVMRGMSWSAFWMGLQYAVPAELTTERLSDALRMLSAATPALRMRLNLDGDAPRVLFVADQHVPVAEQHIAGLHEAAVMGLWQQLNEDTFDPAVEPPIRATLLHREHQSYFILQVHHLVADGESLSLLVSALSEILAGRPAGINGDWRRVVAPQFVDEADVRFWHQLLSLPPPRLFPPTTDTSTLYTRFVIGLEQQKSMERAAQLHGTTPMSVCLSSYLQALEAIFDTRDFLIGCDVSGRQNADFADVVAFRANMLPIPFSVEARVSASLAVKRTHDAVVDALVHAELPLPQIMAAAAENRREAGRQPHLELTVAWLDEPISDFVVDAQSLDRIELPTLSARFPLTLAVERWSYGLHCELSGFEALISAEDLRLLKDTFVSTLATMTQELLMEGTNDRNDR